MRRLIRKALRACGLDLVRYRADTERQPFPSDLTEDDRSVLVRVAPYTMTSIERQVSLIQAVRHLVRHRVEGCIVECGVWRGGSTMAAALTLMQEGDTSRDLFLFDTFEGMPAPTDVDATADGTLAETHLDRDPEKRGWVWAVAGLEEVRENLKSTRYPQEHIKYVQGAVESTIPSCAPPGPIALLRLDTDWYESTRHELIHLFPRLHRGGILIVDDYGHWKGAKRAVDEYFASLGRPYYLHRVDYTARLVVRYE
jgi:hypothetical protein